jgi:hypothetical protein
VFFVQFPHYRIKTAITMMMKALTTAFILLLSLIGVNSFAVHTPIFSPTSPLVRPGKRSYEKSLTSV